MKKEKKKLIKQLKPQVKSFKQNFKYFPIKSFNN